MVASLVPHAAVQPGSVLQCFHLGARAAVQVACVLCALRRGRAGAAALEAPFPARAEPAVPPAVAQVAVVFLQGFGQPRSAHHLRALILVSESPAHVAVHNPDIQTH